MRVEFRDVPEQHRALASDIEQRWGIDLCVTGSQKAWMAAPGLAMIAASERAWAAMETATMPRVYLDLRAHRDAHAGGETPWTPAIAVVYQVDEGIRLMTAEGPESVFARHEACAAAARAGLSALGFELFADPRHASKTVTVTLADVPAVTGDGYRDMVSELAAAGTTVAVKVLVRELVTVSVAVMLCDGVL